MRVIDAYFEPLSWQRLTAVIGKSWSIATIGSDWTSEY
jgi:hypothetical protein